MPLQRQKIIIEGIVQGVGFRPFIYQLAGRFGLDGSVCNDSRGVTIEVEGAADVLTRFVAAVRSEKPPLSSIQSVDIQALAVQGTAGFTILQSTLDESRRAQISPDTFVCDDCLNELFDSGDRRYRYPFINCTNCGPRYTIVTGIPYDRALTTMADFPLCADCRAEYEDPTSRRFHAQPNACPACGPQLQMFDAKGESLTVDDPLSGAIRRLKEGQILAVKGIGGYHLAVDAGNQDAVLELRQRKRRDEKPFALMVKSLEAAGNIAHVGVDEAGLLQGVERPIVLLQKKPDRTLAASIAPANRYLGVMLPYTPLHHLLLHDDFPALVMTSANLSDEPIAYEDDEARRRLSSVADVFLSHNRRIHTRTDDSIARVMADRPLLLRRSRGFVPRAIALSGESLPVLAVGAELKNTVCLTRGDRAFLSQHVGDLKNIEVYDSFRQTIKHLQTILEVRPERVAHDLHPDYDSTRYALEESGLPTVAVQHHHAHMASCLAEHGAEDPAIGVIFDGIGYGTDGHLWGGEFLVGDLRSCERVGHFRYQPMPGGDLATREPWRMALSYLQAAYTELPVDSPAFNNITPADLRLVAQAVSRGINAPMSSSCGRLFDAVAAMLGLRQRASYEGQAALELEMSADPHANQLLPYELFNEGGQIIFDPLLMVRDIFEQQKQGADPATLAGRFHASLAAMTLDVCEELRSRTALQRIVLSGGVFQNCLLTEMTLARLEDSGFEVLMHSLVPPNDGGLALGQAVVAARNPL
ncbi:MAG: carbamoyltransferase HypF [Desulfuromonadales bacterium]|nr:carbamoyltransferase HypF [Desulfuromonadales bacterium]